MAEFSLNFLLKRVNISPTRNLDSSNERRERYRPDKFSGSR